MTGIHGHGSSFGNMPWAGSDRGGEEGENLVEMPVTSVPVERYGLGTVSAQEMYLKC